MLCKYLSVIFYFLHNGLYRAEIRFVLFLVKSNLTIFSFMDDDFGVFKKSSPSSKSSRFSLMLYFRSFINFCFTFGCMVHFELFFLKVLTTVSSLILWHVMPSFFSTVYWEDSRFSIEFPLLLYSKINWLFV